MNILSFSLPSASATIFVRIQLIHESIKFNSENLFVDLHNANLLAMFSNIWQAGVLDQHKV